MILTRSQSVFVVETEVEGSCKNVVKEMKVVDVQTRKEVVYASTTGGEAWEGEAQEVFRLDGYNNDFDMNNPLWNYCMFTDQAAAQAQCAALNTQTINHLQTQISTAKEMLAQLGVTE